MQDAHGEGTLRFMKLWCEETISETILTGAEKYLGKRKLDSVGFIKAHSGFANRPERVQRIKSELQLADSLAQISRAKKAGVAQTSSRRNLEC
jgi:3-deoxy-D-manno-octulosonate 8-phosphate phosphatase KdsC-like HAD superfamily phosphatase